MLSVIIPTYHREFFFKKCINSILRQKKLSKIFKLVEILVVVNHPKNNIYQEMIEAFSKRKNIPKIKFIFNKNNIGLTGSVNTGVKKSRYNYCMVIDDEIILKNNSLFNLVSLLKKRHIKILIGKIIPYFCGAIKKLNYSEKAKLLEILKITKKKEYTLKHYTLINLGEVIKEIKWNLGFMSLMIFNKHDYVKLGGFGPDGFSGEKKILNGNGEHNFTKKVGKVLYYPKLTGYHAMNNKLNSDYLFGRYYNYGVGDSFDNVRNNFKLQLILKFLKYFIKYLISIFLNNKFKKVFYTGYLTHSINFFFNRNFFNYCKIKNFYKYNFNRNNFKLYFVTNKYNLWLF
jgi:glycosyltransferase involved in cell wall biosynthesis